MVTFTGTLLTRQIIDTPKGMVIKLWLQTKEGPLLVEQTAQEGVFFIEDTHVSTALKLTQSLLHRTRPLKLKSFLQQTVTGFYFTNQKNLRRAAKLLKEHGIEALESDVRTVDRYLMERFITSSM